MSIRVAVAGVTLAVMAAFWLVAGAIIDHAYRRLATDAETGLGASARLVALAHSQWVDETQALAAALAAIVPSTAMDPARCHDVLSSTLSNSQGYAAFVVVSPEGMALCGTNPNSPGVDFRDRDYVQRAVQTGGFAVGEYVFGRISNQTVLPTAYAALNSFGEVAFVIIVSKRLDWFQAVADRLHLPGDTRVTLVDRRGAVLASIPRDSVTAGEMLNVPEVLEARTRKSSGALSVADQVHAFVPLGDGALSEISVVVSRPRASLLGAIDEFRLLANLAVAAVMGVTVLLLFHAMRRLVVSPLTHLLDGMHAVHGGNLDWRTDHRAVDTAEMSDLYRGFDDMVAAVGDTQHRIRAQTETLEQSNRDLQHFAYMVSHDLREPLRSVSGFAQLLARRYSHVVDDEGREFVRFITDGAERMSRMLDGVLEYSRIETQGFPPGPVELAQPLDQALKSLHAAIEESGATVECPEPLPCVQADAGQMARLFQNLIANSIKFRLPDTRPVIRLSARRQGGYWEIAVADNGIGISEEGRERVFLLFHRQVRRDSFEGDGIGLAVVKRIVDRHGGTIRAESGTDGGTVILFTLKAAEPVR
ncbi:MAG TPA: ATP-binding protein [Magnetospirillum sp.]|nr:ATP-binding protein [Magnetospirillum sp.]